MKRYDDVYDKVQQALIDGNAVCGLAADGDSNVCINPQYDKNAKFLKSWNVALLIVYKNGTVKYSIDDTGGILELYHSEDTSLDSVRDTIDIFMTLVIANTVEVIEF